MDVPASSSVLVLVTVARLPLQAAVPVAVEAVDQGYTARRTRDAPVAEIGAGFSREEGGSRWSLEALEGKPGGLC